MPKISTNSGQIRPKDPQEHKGEVASTLLFQNFPERKWSPHSPGMRWDNFSSHNHYTVCQWGFYPIVKTCKKWVMTLSSSMAMYSVMRDIPDARKVPIERGWVALSPICHMQIFKSFDFRTMGLWIWITFILIRTVYYYRRALPCASHSEFTSVPTKQERLLDH